MVWQWTWWWWLFACWTWAVKSMVSVMWWQVSSSGGLFHVDEVAILSNWKASNVTDSWDDMKSTCDNDSYFHVQYFFLTLGWEVLAEVMIWSHFVRNLHDWVGSWFLLGNVVFWVKGVKKSEIAVSTVLVEEVLIWVSRKHATGHVSRKVMT